MKKITLENSGIYIYSDVANGFENKLRWNLVCPIEDMQKCIDTLPNVAGKLTKEGDNMIFGGVVDCPDFPTLKSLAEIVDGDVGKKVDAAENIWYTNIIYQQNLLNLDLTKWNLV